MFGDIGEFETTVLTFLLRWGVALLILKCGLRLIKISYTIKNSRFTELAKRCGHVLVLFFIARGVAAVLDAQFSSAAIGVFSSIVNYAFWIWVDIVLIRQHIRLRRPQLGERGLERIRNNIDGIISELSNERDKLITGG